MVETAAKTFDPAVVRVMAPTPGDLEQAFDRMRQENCDALFVLADPTRPAIVSDAKTKITAIYQFSAFVVLGGLASYGAELNRFIARWRNTSTKSSKEPTRLNSLSSSRSLSSLL